MLALASPAARSSRQFAKAKSSSSRTEFRQRGKKREKGRKRLSRLKKSILTQRAKHIVEAAEVAEAAEYSASASFRAPGSNEDVNSAFINAILTRSTNHLHARTGSREYCTQESADDLDSAVLELVLHVRAYEERARLQGNYKPRVVYGLRQVSRNIRQLKCIIVARNLEPSVELDRLLSQVQCKARDAAVPLVFAMSRRQFGRRLGNQPRSVSAVGLLNVDGDANAPFLFVVERSKQLARQWLLRFTRDLDYRNDRNESPLWIACFFGYTEVVRHFVELVRSTFSSEELLASQFATMLQVVGDAQPLERPDLAIRTSLYRLLKDADVVENNTPLHVAASRPGDELAAVLLEVLTDENILATNSSGENAFLVACRTGNVAVIERLHRCSPLLARRMMESRNGAGEGALEVAARHGNLQVLNWICSFCPQEVDPEQAWAAMIAASMGFRTECISFLIRRPAWKSHFISSVNADRTEIRAVLEDAARMGKLCLLHPIMSVISRSDPDNYAFLERVRDVAAAGDCPRCIALTGL